MANDLKDIRRDLRAWAQGRSVEVQTRVNTICANLRALERDPESAALLATTAANVAGLDANRR